MIEIRTENLKNRKFCKVELAKRLKIVTLSDCLCKNFGISQVKKMKKVKKSNNSWDVLGMFSGGDGIGFSRSALVSLSLFALLLMGGFESAVWAYSVSSATPYTGSGYSSYAVCHMRTSAPMMGIQSIGTARGIYTSASAVRGGVTTNDSAAGRKGSPGLKKTPSLPPGACEDCTWVYDEERG